MFLQKFWIRVNAGDIRDYKRLLIKNMKVSTAATPAAAQFSHKTDRKHNLPHGTQSKRIN